MVDSHGMLNKKVCKQYIKWESAFKYENYAYTAICIY